MTLTIVLIIINLIIIESLLSIDNAAVLAVMVKDLPEEQRTKALKYGLLGAYFFRGLCLLLASYLVQILWLKIIGGLYLCYLSYSFFFSSSLEEENLKDKKESKIFKYASKIGLSTFWATVVLVECMDLIFSIDNVFAAVALSKSFWVVMVGVGVGILAMRFVAGYFVKLLEKYPSLETSAFIVIALLGLKLVVSGIVDYCPYMENFKTIIEHHMFDMFFSLGMMLIFFVPLVFKKKKKENERITTVEMGQR